MREQMTTPIARSNQIVATVIIPIKNPGHEIFQILKTLSEQSLQNFDVLLIDSGSDKAKLQRIQEFINEKFTLIQIPANEFAHAKTRNLGVTLAQGEFVVFLTHDAIPASRSWLTDLIQGLLENEKLGATFGPHLAYPQHGPFIEQDLVKHFRNFENRGPAFIEDRLRWREDQIYRQNLHFLSNNNAAYRRKVLDSIPFPDVEFSEDQAWAGLALEAGFGIGYSPEAAVFHSHKFSPLQMFKRSADEGKSLKKIFGYNVEQSLSSAVKNSLGITRSDISMWLENRKTIHFSTLFARTAGIFLSRLGYLLGARIAKGQLRLLNGFSLDDELRNGKRGGDFRKL